MLHFPYRFIKETHEDYNPKNPFHKILIPDVLNNYENCNVKMINLMLHYFYEVEPEMPKSVSLAKRCLIGSIDDVEQFLQLCTFGAGNSEGKELYHEYVKYGGELKIKAFRERMKDKGYEYKKVSIFGSKVHGYKGVRFGEGDNADDPE